MTEHKKAISQYRGRLTPQQAADGIAVALSNARALVKDAELLLEHQRHARATALAILAIEEAGKLSVIRALLVARDESELREERRPDVRLSQKNGLYHRSQVRDNGTQTPSARGATTDTDAEQPNGR